MEIALTFLGVILGLLALLFTYVWRVNGKIQKAIMDIVKEVASEVKGVAEMQKIMIDTLDRMDKRAQENRRETMQALKEISQMLLNQNEGIKSISQMLLNQTKILERIEGKIR